MSGQGSAARVTPSPAPRPAPRPRPQRDAEVRELRPRVRAAEPEVESRPAKRAGFGGFMALIVGLLASGLFALLLLNTTLGEGSFRIKAMQVSLSQLTEQQQQLQRQVALADSPLTLAARARALGMVPSASPVFLRLSDGRILGVPVAATAPPVVSPPVIKAAPKPSPSTTTKATTTTKPTATKPTTTTTKPTATKTTATTATKPKH